MNKYVNIWDAFWQKWVKENPREYYKKQEETSTDYWEFNKQIIDNKIIVEIGCGIGRVAKRVAVNTNKYYGFDISPFAIDVARKTSPLKTEFVVITDESLVQYQRLLKESVDTVIVRQVFIHLGEELIRKYLRFTYDILKPEGLIECTFYYHPTKNVGEDGIVDKNVEETSGEVTLFTKEDIERLMKEAKLQIIFIEYTNERYLVRAVKNE